MSLNPLGIGLTYYNNWHQDDDQEFILFSCEFGKKNGVLFITMGIAGVGFYLCKAL